ncbi:MAG: bifunctional diaminohydroxyphosphoribosylaminopyrimidine deaminase/5-amino-6-(5-phosphoribosylamino)uracil reductase RibD [Armatimonadota bacterium]
MALSEADFRWMRRAVQLAQRGFPAPNPHVGAVVVADGEQVGEGFHPYAGAPHAEVFALQQAGARARNATLYVTLEPCCHHGRTPPCTQAILQAGIRRVVVAMRDPNPKVAGQGLRELQAAGVQVELLDEGDPRAQPLLTRLQQINRAFLHYHQVGRPLITLKGAASLDGKIATYTGDSKWITGERARREAHRLRAEHGCVLVGVNTVLKDDPLLTARLRGVKNQPLRVVLDSRLRTPPHAQIARTQDAPTLLFCTEPMPAHAAVLQQQGVEIVALPPDAHGRVPVAGVVDHLAQRGVIGILVEGGGEVIASFLQAGLADQIAFFYAPLLIGGRDAPTLVEGIGVAEVASAWRVSNLTFKRLGSDWLLMATLTRRP